MASPDDDSPPSSVRGVAGRAPIVWLVDDSPLQAEMGRRALGPLFATRIFGGGPEVLEALSSETPDLLILDFEMPEMSGIDVCKHVRETRSSVELPILMLTGSATPDTLISAFAAEANDFVTKPFSPPELFARASALVRTRTLHARVSTLEQQLRVEAHFREDFIGMLAHDLRQPLSAFSLAGGALAASLREGNDHGKRLLMIQDRAAARMGRMVRDLLDMTRSRPAAGMPIERVHIDLPAVLGELVEEIRAAHPVSEITLTCHGACSGDWDVDRISQLFGNLLTNAIEHGAPRRPVEISVHCHETEVTVCVVNEGATILPETLAHVFDRFRRGRGGPKGGIGLGLHIASEIVRAHGGTISVRSTESRTVFETKLPRHAP
jgi:signal transduction histidine kinase